MTPNPKEPARFVPPGQEALPEDERLSYLLRVPTVWDRAALARAVSLRGGRRHNSLALLQALRRGIEEIFAETAGDDQETAKAAHLAEIDRALDRYAAYYEALRAGVYEGEEGGKAFVAELRELGALDDRLAPIADVVVQTGGRYAQMVADNDAYQQVQALCAAQLFVVGWEGFAVPFRRRAEGLPDDLLGAIPGEHVFAIAGEVERLMAPTAAQRKNSSSPSPGPSDPAPSTAAN